MNIIIPMAGLSSRFKKSGYNIPKYMLYAKGKSLFNHSVSSFSKYFSDANFIFIIRNIFGSTNFVNQECDLMGIKKYKIICLDKLTSGQAETSYLGIIKSKINTNSSLLIFNIDTIRRNFLLPKLAAECDGYLEVFKGSGNNWSYAKLNNKTKNVEEVAEKKQISNLCSTGLYFFKNSNLFIEAFLNYKNERDENYVAPIYNYLIKKGFKINVDIILKKDVVFSGTPQEYINFKK